MWVRTDRGGSGWIGPTDEKLRGGETENKCSTIIVFGVSPPFSVQSQRCIILTEITVEPRVRFRGSEFWIRRTGMERWRRWWRRRRGPSGCRWRGGHQSLSSCCLDSVMQQGTWSRDPSWGSFLVNVSPWRCCLTVCHLLPPTQMHAGKGCVCACCGVFLKTHPSKLWFSFSKVY